MKRFAAMLRSLRTRIFLLIVLPLIAVALVAAVLRHMVAAETAEKLLF